MDESFVRRSYRSIALAWAIAMTWTLAFQKPWIALSITLGTLLGTAILASNSWIIPRIFTPGMRRPTRQWAKVLLIKYALMIGALYLALRWQKINALALCGGVVLVHVAIVLKSLGATMFERRWPWRK